MYSDLCPSATAPKLHLVASQVAGLSDSPDSAKNEWLSMQNHQNQCNCRKPSPVWAQLNVHNVLLCWKMLTGNPKIHVGCSACKSSCQNAWEIGVWSWVMHSNFKATALRLVQRLNGSRLHSAHALRFESGFNSFKNCSHLQSVFFTWPTATWLYSTPRRSLPAPISIQWAIETNWQSHDAIFVEFPLSLEWLEQHSVSLQSLSRSKPRCCTRTSVCLKCWSGKVLLPSFTQCWKRRLSFPRAKGNQVQPK